MVRFVLVIQTPMTLHLTRDSSRNVDHSNLPARKLYEGVFPQIIKEFTDPPLPYHRGSPYGGEGWNTADQTVGDIHIWDVWGGKELPYQNYDKMYGRFVR